MNRPRKQSILYRSADHDSLRRAMLDRLSETSVENAVPLRGINPHQPHDGTVALIDLWASVGDVLTFYQERIANEAYLRTATRAASVRRLTALLDHRPDPGRAATAHVAFLCEKDQTPHVPAGTAVVGSNTDGPPVPFETDEPLDAHHALDTMALRTHAPHRFQPGDQHVDLDGHNHNLRPGDPVLFADQDGHHALRILVRVTEDPDKDRTRLEWDGPLDADLFAGPTDPRIDLLAFDDKARPLDHDAPTLVARLTIPQATPRRPPAPTLPDLRPRTLPTEARLHLDDLHDAPGRGGPLLLLHRPTHGPPTHQVRTVRAACEDPVSTRRRSAIVTRIDLDAPLDAGTPRRRTTIHFGARTLPRSPTPQPPLAAGTQELPLDAHHPVPPWRRILVTWSAPDGPHAHLLTSASARHGPDPHDDPPGADDTERPLRTTLLLDGPLPVEIPRHARVHGNVVPATQGKQVGPTAIADGTDTPFQQAPIPDTPITHVADPTAPHGVRSTLEIRVDHVLWHPIRRITKAGPDDRAYELRQDADGRPIVRFGDQQTGQRVPTGTHNIQARHRQGLGTIGNLPPGALDTTPDPPHGIKAVTNPTPSTGGVDPETPGQIRERAPRGVRTLGRVISLRDLEDAALDFSGISKTRATHASDDHGRLLHLTVAGENGALVDDTLRIALWKYLDARRDPLTRIHIRPHRPTPVHLHARVQVHPDHDEATVHADVSAALVADHRFERLGLGTPLHLSDLYRIIQRRPGVLSAYITNLRLDTDPTPATPTAAPTTTAAPTPPDLLLAPDQIAVLTPDTIHLTGGPP